MGTFEFWGCWDSMEDSLAYCVDLVNIHRINQTNRISHVVEVEIHCADIKINQYLFRDHLNTLSRPQKVKANNDRVGVYVPFVLEIECENGIVGINKERLFKRKENPKTIQIQIPIDNRNP